MLNQMRNGHNGHNGTEERPHRPAEDWIVRPVPNPNARLRLWCFHYAGGSASLYQEWPDALPDDVEVCAVQLPGRGQRFPERPYRQLASLVTALADVLGPEMEQPFAFFGYSMGALVAFEFARELRRRGLPAPLHLFVAARRAPQLPPPLNHQLSGLADDELLKFLGESGNDKMSGLGMKGALARILLPTLRSDCQVAETYTYQTDEPLDCSISAYGGNQDPYVLEKHLREWRVHTRADFDLQMFEGNHFFLHRSLPLLPETVGQSLQLAYATTERETL